MSSEPLIEVRSLGKRYDLGGRATPTRLSERIGQRRRSPSDQVWALRDVSFNVSQGEVLGLIGHNGAGKSTLLKILTRVVTPTEGSAVLRGRVGSLLEVGTGFHPELSGRENIFLNGALLGMSRREVQCDLASIVEFAGVDRYIDVPVKRYSSGMYTRLAFSVAAHLKTEVLLVDEVLAVGDAEFQQKSLGRMRDAAESGRTVIFVSHSMTMVSQLCTSCVWLNRGLVQQHGAARDVIGAYLRSGGSDTSLATFEADPRRRVQYRRIEIRNGETRTASFAQVDPIDMVVELEVRDAVPGDYLTMVLRSESGGIVLVTDHRDVQPPVALTHGTHQIRLRLPGGLLNEGTYTVTMGAASPYDGNIDRCEAACRFEVHDLEGARASRPGVLAPRIPWESFDADVHSIE